MYKNDLVQELIRLARSYGLAHFGSNYAHPGENMQSSIIFNDPSYNFHKDSWKVIQSNPEYKERPKKIHSNTQTSGIFEMQSSNSSDTLAMNIFCFPDFKKWKGTKDLFDVKEFQSIEFGFKPEVLKGGVGDATEVDVYINKSVICECKLTEDSFTLKAKESIEQYDTFKEVFHTNNLIQDEGNYSNYQLIRNILAAHQIKDGRFILICDMRRPDLAKRFYQTVRCIRDIELRMRCEIIYWQDIANACGAELKAFLKEKYGI